MKQILLILLTGLLLAGCEQKRKKSEPANDTDDAIDLGADANVLLQDARKGFKTRPVAAGAEEMNPPPQPPPPRLFRMVRYDAPLGKFAAYLTPAPKDGKKRPAIIWITGGDCNSIDQGSWEEGDPENDQSASAFRKAGIVMMFPSLRGGNGATAAKREAYFGEVDDVLAAADFLSKQPFVDPKRIYLGGHSTGGTLVFLVAECSNRFRAVFSFGPVEDVRGYEPQYRQFDSSNRRECELRAPIRWLHSIQSPLFVLEGDGIPGNVSSLEDMAKACKNPLAHFYPVEGADHFSVLQPTTRLLAQKILQDTGPTCNISLTEDELNELFTR